MSHLFAALRTSPFLPPALAVPMVIALVFSLFSLTAAPDPARLAAAIRLGVVNEDAGLRLPPIRIADRMVEGMKARLPFALVEIADAEAGRAALEAGEISALLTFPDSFSRDVTGDGTVGYRLLLAENLPSAEAQVAGQLPAMLEGAMSAAVSTVRLALAQGRLPDLTPPVAGTVERLHPIERPAQRVAPFVAVFVTWLAALVGALLAFLAARPLPSAAAAQARSLLPVVSSGLASLVLALTLAATAGTSAGLLPLWLSAWAAMVALGWGFAGLLAWLGLPALVILVPVVFYQAAVGGAQIPLAAAPDWLGAATLGLPFDRLGGLYRALLLGGPVPAWTAPLAIVAATGLALIWAKAAGRRGTALA